MKARLSNLRIAPRKVRLVADLIRGKQVQEARTILRFTRKKGAGPLLKLLESAAANAGKEGLRVQSVRVDEGRKLRRFMPRARGAVSQIQKKTSHITIELGETRET